MARRKGRNGAATATNNKPTTSTSSTSTTRATSATSATSSSPSASKRGAVGGKDAFDDLFARFRDPLPEGGDEEEEEDAALGPDGLERLCGELGVDPASRALLILAQQCECGELGLCRRDELRRGLAKLGWQAANAHDAFALKKAGSALKALDRALKDAGRSSPLFLELYKFTFELCKASKQAKVVHKAVAAPMMALALGEDAPHVKSFTQFLEASTEYRVLNIDQWLCFLQFSNSVDEKLDRYSDEDSWPSLLDEFVEFKRKAVEAN